MESDAIASKRTLFDQTCFNVLSYLEKFEEICEIDFIAKDGVQAHDMSYWERKNFPYKLPSDLKAFYGIFNGLSCRWKVEVSGKRVQIGEMLLSQLESISRGTIEGQHNSPDSNISIMDSKNCVAFALDGFSAEFGSTYLVYKLVEPESAVRGGTQIDQSNKLRSSEDPEVWFKDLSARWHFLTYTFTNYMRLLVTHLGIFGWQMAYSPEGLHESTHHWMRFFCMERLCVDLNHQYNRKVSVAGNNSNSISLSAFNLNDRRKGLQGSNGSGYDSEKNGGRYTAK